MKTKFFTLFAAFTLLFGAKAMAQTTGDVNEDGVVNEQDITAIIQIMQEAGGVKEQTKYYWYIGQENPANMTSISPIVTDNTSPGWRETGKSLTATYNYDTTNNPISSTPIQMSEWYFALPENTGLGVFDAQGENYAVNPVGSVTIPANNGVKYNIYKTGKTPKFSAYVIKNK